MSRLCGSSQGHTLAEELLAADEKGEWSEALSGYPCLIDWLYDHGDAGSTDRTEGSLKEEWGQRIRTSTLM